MLGELNTEAFYQTYNSFGEIIFRKTWSLYKAHPTLQLTTFFSHDHWVFY